MVLKLCEFSKVRIVMKTTDRIKCIVFDFDNVLILDEKTGIGSEELKMRIWIELFHELKLKKMQDDLHAFIKQIGGGKGDRMQIAEYLLKKHRSTRVGLIEERAKSICAEFDKRVRSGVLQIGISQKKIEFLKELRKRYALYVNTGTPVDSVEKCISELGITDCFDGIYGRPNTKKENLRLILKREGISADELVYIDDQPSGFSVAQDVGCWFIGMRTKAIKAWFKKPLNFPIVQGIADVEHQVDLLTKETLSKNK